MGEASPHDTGLRPTRQQRRRLPRCRELTLDILKECPSLRRVSLPAHEDARGRRLILPESRITKKRRTTGDPAMTRQAASGATEPSKRPLWINHAKEAAISEDFSVISDSSRRDTECGFDLVGGGSGTSLPQQGDDTGHQRAGLRTTTLAHGNPRTRMAPRRPQALTRCEQLGHGVRVTFGGHTSTRIQSPPTDRWGFSVHLRGAHRQNMTVVSWCAGSSRSDVTHGANGTDVPSP